MLEYDPDKTPDEPSDELIEKAESLGLRIVQVICSDPDKEQGSGVTFNAMLSVMPRAGDLIVLENKRVCEVNRAYFTTIAERNASGKIESILLHPIIFAVLRRPKESPPF